MTLTQCRTKFCEKINFLYNSLLQAVGITTEDEYNKIVYGFEESVLNLINQTASAWNEHKIYEDGDLVERFGQFYVSRKDFNQGQDPATKSFYWLKKQPNSYYSNGNIVAYLCYENGIIVKQKNIASVVWSSNRFDINFTTAFADNRYCVIFGDRVIGGTQTHDTIRIDYKSNNTFRGHVMAACGATTTISDNNLSFEMYILNS